MPVITLENGLYVRVSELQSGPTPFPLKSGFNTETAYRTLGMFNPSETSDAYFILANDRDEVWFICNRHLRFVGVLRTETAARLPLFQALQWVQQGGAPAHEPAHHRAGPERMPPASPDAWLNSVGAHPGLA